MDFNQKYSGRQVLVYLAIILFPIVIIAVGVLNGVEWKTLSIELKVLLVVFIFAYFAAAERVEKRWGLSNAERNSKGVSSTFTYVPEFAACVETYKKIAWILISAVTLGNVLLLLLKLVMPSFEIMKWMQMLVLGGTMAYVGLHLSKLRCPKCSAYVPIYYSNHEICKKCGLKLIK